MRNIREFVFRLLVWLDQGLNVLTWINGDGFGYPDETLSARSWRLREQSGAWRLIDAIFGDGHCRAAYESEVMRRQLPRTYQAAEMSEAL